jgi:hypothetical protein
MDPGGRQRSLTKFFEDVLSRLTLGLDQGCDAYLRFFREASA